MSGYEHDDEEGRRLPKIVIGEGIPEAMRVLLEGQTMSMMGKSITDKAPVPDYVATLRKRSELMREFNPDYAVHDIVRFKDGLNHTRITGFMIVHEINPYAEGVRGSDDTHTAGYCDKQNVKVAVIVNNGFFLEFLIDGRRIEKVPEDQLALLD